MRLVILGGGGFRVPLVYRALLADHRQTGITEVALHDVDPGRLHAIGRVLHALARDVPDAPTVHTTTDLDTALTGATFVFSAIRVGGLHGRVVDERVARAAGILGQETVGAGGIAYGLRSVPESLRIAERVAAVAPDAWVINFTNPAGLVTEAMSGILGDRVIGICDSPTGLVDRVLRVLDAPGARVDYAGLNHLGWLYGVYDAAGRDLLPGLLADEAGLATIEEGRLFPGLRELGAIPNEYLHYYYHPVAKADGPTRGEFLAEQQERCYREMSAGEPLEAWLRAWREREATYMADNRSQSGAGDRDHDESRPAGYEGVALAVMRALARDEPAELILGVRNRGVLDVLDADAVVEVPCRVDGTGAVPRRVGALPGHAVGLVQTVKAVERGVLEAVQTGSAAAAVRAMAGHPLVGDPELAGRLIAAYRAELPELAYLS
ncbi:6-phospho-beta-glucosidase [Actinoplanes sp. SE50]|uniref:family 4 glycosyl hydrolase n=1 Tax=unclassified Actinoplanes TaxID=2626549 RepID=UPI00023EBF6F|nr:MULTISPECIES: 6-phospho-beta-glucosidase [unclassified Actinoplanes]AEV86290.1 6-phospho-beta-glucosidase [Actinoplanes sp. SE50/110]ATO84687.1 6-phospho-beta-glucosidase [Actinoplanes sp. SE50]SLM02097.1 6-phospho-beta-glucosidase [Actinoplanes sp. SE50/110]